MLNQQNLKAAVIASAICAPILPNCSAIANDVPPTLAQCTCHFDDKAPPDQQGARASNGTLCVQMLNKRHHWCQITIACLRGNIGPKCRAKSAPGKSIYDLYGFAARSIAASKDAAAAIFLPTLTPSAQAIAALSNKNSQSIAACAASYTNNSKERRHESAGGFNCTFNPATRWLVYTFYTDQTVIQFSFGPKE